VITSCFPIRPNGLQRKLCIKYALLEEKIEWFNEAELIITYKYRIDKRQTKIVYYCFILWYWLSSIKSTSLFLS
jgi:hypothetical protein